MHLGSARTGKQKKPDCSRLAGRVDPLNINAIMQCPCIPIGVYWLLQFFTRSNTMTLHKSISAHSCPAAKLRNFERFFYSLVLSIVTYPGRLKYLFLLDRPKIDGASAPSEAFFFCFSDNSLCRFITEPHRWPDLRQLIRSGANCPKLSGSAARILTGKKPVLLPAWAELSRRLLPFLL